MTSSYCSANSEITGTLNEVYLETAFFNLKKTHVEPIYALSEMSQSQTASLRKLNLKTSSHYQSISSKTLLKSFYQKNCIIRTVPENSPKNVFGFLKNFTMNNLFPIRKANFHSIFLFNSIIWPSKKKVYKKSTCIEIPITME